MLPTRIALRGLARHARKITPLSPAATDAGPSTTDPETPSTSSASASASASASGSSSGSRIGQYLVSRSASGELPVYSENTRGTVWKTIIRRVDGDAMTLRDDLTRYMQEIHIDPLRPAPGVTVKPTSQNLVIKGRWVGEIKGFLESRGF